MWTEKCPFQKKPSISVKNHSYSILKNGCMSYLKIISILFSELNISTLIKINITRMMETVEEEHVRYTGLCSHLSQAKVTLEHPCWKQWGWLVWLGCFCSPQASPACGCTHFASKGQWAVSAFLLPASCSAVHFLQLRAMLQKPSGDTLLTVSGWRAVSQTSIPKEL